MFRVRVRVFTDLGFAARVFKILEVLGFDSGFQDFGGSWFRFGFSGFWRFLVSIRVSRFRVSRSGFQVWCFEVRGFQVRVFEFQIRGSGFRGSGFSGLVFQGSRS